MKVILGYTQNEMGSHERAWSRGAISFDQSFSNFPLIAVGRIRFGGKAEGATRKLLVSHEIVAHMRMVGVDVVE